MAANFWNSTHYCNWLQNADALLKEALTMRTRDRDLFSEEQLVRIRVCYAQFIASLAKKANLRQRVAATALVYFKRFYLRNAYKEHDPRLIAPTALYLAAKTEEHTVPAKAIISQVNAMYKADHPYPYTIKDIYDYEFRIIAELECDLIIFHSYRPLTQLCADSAISDCFQTAWAILNDSYRTDICLLYPPYIIAVACIFMAASILERNPLPWLQALGVDVTDVISVVNVISNLYSPLTIQQSSPKFLEVINGKLHRHFAHVLGRPTARPIPTPATRTPSTGIRTNRRDTVL
eukprot:Plantae.Rhodophyta-Rhodochaete_pulchella.ctg6379.p2 GENE.Plantae.Rhodophyta-Rhodochaete_pulchella.ctg6379~~Plantae.Rhodophyta-Rhodochaete_pulchella.ctg6379.p2  ORF type:complete len:292 (-),score=32.07 Plantae.Rhodophyta-Rhodochaete_pulchella.ctg6379:2066-2941(-)